MADLRRSAGLLWSAVRRDKPKVAATAVGLDILVNLGGRPLAGLWLKLLVDAAAGGQRTTVVVVGVALAVSMALQGTIGTAVGVMMSDLHESSAQVLIGDLMRLSAGVPGIEHHERPEYADRIALLRGQGRLLTNFVGTFGANVGLLTQIVMTIALLATVHPALLLLPVLAVPSVWAGSRANAIAEKARGGHRRAGAAGRPPLRGGDLAGAGEGGPGIQRVG